MDKPIERFGLDGFRILIVEDEYYLAADLAGALRGQGAEVIGPVATLDDATASLDTGRFDCAVLDIRLRGGTALPLADRLRAAGVPFVIASGYDGDSLPERFAATPRVEKPYAVREVVALLRGLFANIDPVQSVIRNQLI